MNFYFDNNNKRQKKQKRIAIIASLFIFCIVVAVVIFLLTNQNFNPNNPRPTSSQGGKPQASNTQIKESNNPNTQSPDPSIPPTPTPRLPKELEIFFENDTLYIKGFTSEYEFTTEFSNDKKFVSNEFRNPNDPKRTSWYEINNESKITLFLMLDEYNTYSKQRDTIFVESDFIHEIDIRKDNTNTQVMITFEALDNVVIKNIENEDELLALTFGEFKNIEFFNFSNVYSRKFFFLSNYLLCKQSDSSILYYEDKVFNGRDDLYTIRIPSNNNNRTFRLEEEKVYVNDSCMEYFEVREVVLGNGTFYEIDFLFKKEIILYPNSNDWYSTLTFLDPNIENLIFVDAGHGGHDPGTLSREEDKLHEAYINLEIAKLLEVELIKRGHNVFMSRNEDVFLGYVLERGDMANITNSILFISIHINSYDDTRINGITTIWREDEEKELAQIIQRNVSKKAVAIDRGIMQQMLATHGQSEAPAITLEAGFITNPEESNKLKYSLDYQQRIAEGLANGIEEYLQTRPSEN